MVGNLEIEKVKTIALTTYGWIAGITGLLITILCYLFGGMFIARYMRSRRTETFVQGLSFFALGSNWLAAGFSFLKILMDGEPPGQITMIRAWIWAPALTATIWMYLVLSLIRPNLKIIGGAIYILLDVVLIALMFARPLELSTYQIIGGFPDVGVQGVAIAFLLFYILSAVVLISPMYLYIGFKSKHSVIRLKGKIIGLGVMIFALFSIFETVIGPSAALLILSRILLLCSILLIYFGLILPDWIRRRFLVADTAVA